MWGARAKKKMKVTMLNTYISFNLNVNELLKLRNIHTKSKKEGVLDLVCGSSYQLITVVYVRGQILSASPTSSKK
jgi:predicted oxidoreductase